MRKKITILTGAGISAESGIQTFRDSDGLWKNHKFEDVASIEGWRRNKQLVLDFYNERRNGLKDVQPNSAHIALAELEKDFDVTIVTQNVDDLHERAGSTNVLHLHGELNKMCSSNNKNLTLPYVEDIKLGDKHPDGSQLRPFIVWFGESVPSIAKAAKEISDCDIFVIVGTSLQVYPAAGLIEYADTAKLIYYIDKNPTSIDNTDKLDGKIICIESTATEGMKTLMAALKDEYKY